MYRDINLIPVNYSYKQTINARYFQLLNTYSLCKIFFLEIFRTWCNIKVAGIFYEKSFKNKDKDLARSWQFCLNIYIDCFLSQFTTPFFLNQKHPHP